MKKAISRLFLLWLLAAGAFITPASAQPTTGNIKGQVTDNEGNALPGASVSVKGTTRSAVTGLTGTFQIIDMRAGTYTIVITYMGYKTSESEVTVSPGSTFVKNYALQSNSTNLESVIVSAVQEGQQKALNQQKNSDNMKQVISADLMSRYPDLNVAESMQRLPGVTIGRNSSGEGSTIQLRGTPAYFTNINVNGEQIMSTQEDGQRSVTLDVIPTSILSTMEVNKTLMPDQDGDAIAGTVNLTSPTATSLHPKFSVDLGGGYNNLRSNLNAIGNITAGQRFFRTKDNPNGRLGIMLNGSLYKTKNGYDEQNAQVWQQKDFGDNKGEIWFPTDIRYLYVQNQRTRTGGGATIDYNFNATSSITANVMYSDNYNEVTRYRKRTRMQTKNTTVDPDGAYTTTKGRSYNEIKGATDDNNNLTFNLNGETLIGKVKLDGGLYMGKAQYTEHTGTYNFITGNIPLSISDISGDEIITTGADWRNDASLFTYNTVEREQYHNVGRNFVTKLNMTLPYKIGNNSAVFKAGYKTKFTHSERYYPTNVIISTYAGDAGVGSLNNFRGPAEVSSDLLDNSFDFGLGVDKNSTVNFFDTHLATDFPLDSSSIHSTTDTYYYDATEDITAGYLMNRIQFNKVMLLTGLRIEHTTVDYKGNIVQLDDNGIWLSTQPNQKKTSYTKFLPNIQAKYDINKSTDVRGGLTFGYSRPNFIDLVPGRLISVLAMTVTDGNPELKPAFSTNADLMIEKYLSNLGILSAGAFYKNIDKFQYNSVTVLQGDEFQNANLYTGYQWFRTLNGNTAKVYGLELNAQANLTFLPGILKGFSILANYTYSHSDADAQFRKGLRLPGQATHSANGSLAFNYKGLTLQGNVNYNGSYTVALGGDAASDVIRAARVQVDANASFRINKRFTVYMEGQNLTNAPQTDYFGIRSRLYTKQYYSYWGRMGVKFRL
jgi:TonB-dependent receptor